MGHSERCRDLKTYWNRSTLKCVPCPVKPGYGTTPNCGYDDDGGRHEGRHKECIAAVTFNDGGGADCRPCGACPRGMPVLSACTTTSDTQCRHPRREVPVTETTSHYVSSVFSASPTVKQESGSNTNEAEIHQNVDLLWVVPFSILMAIMFVVICACLICMKRKRGQRSMLSYCRRSSYINTGFSPLSAPHSNNDLEHILSPNIMTAPLQRVLDNLDVLEELVILLDPENQGVKSTKHLASHCSFPATWITYAYSMKDSKSPLKALLEGVTSRHPDWTVGHLSKLLKHMERNDAIAVLAKLELNEMQV
ncbi:IGF-like family receptor 1 [Clinocottus analis]|uniref:IGF-like family receptor 1 n=1 Tax=Clinocottus analis TaxID=304258 RepID=UPI0035BFE33B